MQDPIVLKTMLHIIGAGLGVLGFVAGGQILGLASQPRGRDPEEPNTTTDTEGPRQRTLWAMFLFGIIGGVFVIILAAR